MYVKGFLLQKKLRTTPLGLGAKPGCQVHRKKPAHLGMVGAQTSTYTEHPHFLGRGEERTSKPHT